MIKFNEPYITDMEEFYIKDVFKRNQFYGNGHYTQKCHDLIKGKISCKDILLTDSCTSALEICALLLRDWNKKQEVIVPSYTFSSTAAAFARAGYKVVFAEIDPMTMMLDAAKVESKITDNTAAIVLVHYAGFGGKAKIFNDICKKNSIYLVEDAAQGFGCVEDKNFLGTVGDFGCFSFHETKNLHAGLSGALAVNNENFTERAMHIWERGTNRQDVIKGIADKYSWVEIGGSFYPTELQSAFLFAQLKSYEKNLAERKEVFCGYNEVFSEEQLQSVIYPKISNNFQTNYHAFWLLFSKEAECDYVRSELLKESIHAYIGYVPLHSSKVGLNMGYKASDLEITEDVSKRILRLPIHNKMKKADAKIIARLVIKYLKEFKE